MPAAIGERPSSSPASAPSVTPNATPTTTSISVVARWGYRLPCSHPASFTAIRLGRLVHVPPEMSPTASQHINSSNPTAACQSTIGSKRLAMLLAQDFLGGLARQVRVDELLIGGGDRRLLRQVHHLHRIDDLLLRDHRGGRHCLDVGVERSVEF